MNQRYEGSILLSALLFVYFGSALLMTALENFQISHKFARNHHDFYSGKIMASMFLAEVKHMRYPLKDKETLFYNLGQLTYTYEKQQLTIVVEIKGRALRYEFHEPIDRPKNIEN